MSLGDFDTGAVIYGKFSTQRPSTGAPFTLAGSPALSVYKDNSTTQSTAGVTLTADFDSVTGLNHFAIDTSADGSFYSAGSFFDIVITTGTVDSVSAIGFVVERFTLRKNSALKPATAGRTLVVDAAGLADANVVKLGPSGAGTAQTARDVGASVLLSSGTGTGQLDFTSGVVKSNLVQILGTALTETAGQIAAGFKKLFDVALPVFTLTSVNQTGDAYGRIGANGAGLTALGDTRIAHLDADISSRMATFSYTAPDNAGITAIKVKTDNLPSDPADASDIADAFGIVGTAITSLQSHGDSAWATATGFSTSADITGAVSTLEGYGDTHWATATGFSTYDGSDTAGTTTLLARLTATRAGNLDNLDAAVTSRLASADYTAPDNTAVLAAIAGLNDLSTADVTSAVPSAADNAEALLAATYEGSETVQSYMRLTRAGIVGKANGLATTTAHYRDAADTKNRITATVDADGNRSAVTTDAT